jgi:glycosyltransferase involved in cell wall biosynthesis
MRNLFCTADHIGSQTGGGVVTWNELQALREFGGNPDQLSMANMQTNGLPWTPYIQDYLADAYVLQMLAQPIDLAHFYSGMFGKTIWRLKAAGAKVTQTIAAHDMVLSAEEFAKYGMAYDFPHLTRRELFLTYVEGQLMADKVICPSTQSAEIVKRYGVRDPVVIPHGIPGPLSAPAPLPEKFTVGYLGQSGPDKGLWYLLEAWSKLNLSNCKLLLAGRGIEQMAPIWQHVGGRGEVQFLGWVKDVNAFYDSISCYVQPSVCMPTGSFILDGQGISSIESPGEQVISSDGNLHRVIRPTQRHYTGQLVSITCTGFGLPVRMTPEHRVLCIKRSIGSSKLEREKALIAKRVLYDRVMSLRRNGLGSRRIANMLGVKETSVVGWIYGKQKPGCVPTRGKTIDQSAREAIQSGALTWVKAGELEEKDVVVIPRMKKCEALTRISLGQPCRGNASWKLPKYLPASADVLRMIGYYISEGCASTKGELIFCFSGDEIAYAKDVAECIKRHTGVSCRISRHKHKNSMIVRCSSKQLTDMLAAQCGRGAHNKHLPNWALSLPAIQLNDLLCGVWRGDGSVFVTNLKDLRTGYSTVSRTLAIQLFVALTKLGFTPMLHANRNAFELNLAVNVKEFVEQVVQVDVPEHVSRRKTRRTVIDDNYYYLPIRQISREPYTGAVHNLEVQADHSYAAPFVVHNSEGFGIEVLEATARGRPVIVSDGAGASNVITGSQDGFVFQKRDVEGLCDCIQLLHEDDAMLERMGSAARLTAEKYTWDKIIPQYQALWKELLK